MDYRPHRRSEEELQRLIFQRALHHLCHIRPNVPFPLVFLDQVLDVDLFVEDPPDLVKVERQTDDGRRWIDYAFAPQDAFALDAGELFDITGPDFERTVITVSEMQRVELQSLIAEIKRSGQWVKQRVLEDSIVVMMVRLHQIVSMVRDHEQAIAPDHLALLASHGLYWLEGSLADENAEGAYTAVQLSDALWMLVLCEAIAPAKLTPLVPQVVEHVECFGGGWRDALPVSFLASWAATMAETGEPELQPWVERIFSVGQSLVDILSDEEAARAEIALFKAGQRAGLED